MALSIFSFALLSVALASSCVRDPATDLPGFPVPITGGVSACASMCQVEPLCTHYAFSPSCPEGFAGCTLSFASTPTSTPVNPRPHHPLMANKSSGTPYSLRTSTVSATVTDTAGLTSLSITGTPTLSFQLDTLALSLNGNVLNTSALPTPAVVASGPAFVSLEYISPPFTLTITYDVLEGFDFIRKQLSISSSTPSSPVTIDSISPWDTLVVTAPTPLTAAVYPSGTLGTYGVFARFGDGSGITAAATNPFLTPTVAPAFSPNTLLFHVGYHPAMVWNFSTPTSPTPTPFIADSGLLGVHMLTPNFVPPHIDSDAGSSRWKVTAPYVGALSGRVPGVLVHSTDTFGGMLFEGVSFLAGGAPPTTLAAPPSWLNYAERDAFRQMGEAHFLLPPSQSVRIHIPWTENDYQVDISNATQWPEYQRILMQLGRMGVDRILFAGTDSAESSVANCTDDWCWEETLWLSMGEKIRQGLWTPGVDPNPDIVDQLTHYAQGYGTSAVPYVYPILGFTAGSPGGALPPWLYSRGGGKYYADLGNRAFQDYFINLTVAFSQATSSSGVGYDYTYFEAKTTSVFAQFYGWRRIMGEVRKQMSGGGQADYVVDNRQASHSWSPWMWAVGSYAEPLQSDEQTTSWTAYVPDIHIDRTDGNRQREMNYDYSQNKLCQPSAMPGFFGHNTDRCGAPGGGCPFYTWNIRDFDYFGNPFSLISAIATGGVNAVVCDIPARDEEEFNNFPSTAPFTTSSLDLFHFWLDFARSERAYLLKTSFLPQPPSPGAIDGTYAILPQSNTGYIFLFNPNSPSMSTPPGLLVADRFNLGLNCTPGVESFTLSEVWPIPTPAFTTVVCGGNFSLAVEGRNARVLSIAPSNTTLAQGKKGEVVLLGRGVRPGWEAELVASGSGSSSRLRVKGEFLDAAPPLGVDACPTTPILFALIPTLSLSSSTLDAVVEVVVVGSKGGEEAVASGFTLAAAGPRVAQGGAGKKDFVMGGCWPLPHSFSPSPFTPPGYTLFELTPLAAAAPAATARVTPSAAASPLAATTFVHNAPVAGLGVNASFTGGTLHGVVNVPAAVFTQLTARPYPVPWTELDNTISWLNPSRLLLYVDAGHALTSDSVVTATLDGTPLPILPSWSCRTTKEARCFMGFWADVSGVAPGVDHPLTVTVDKVPAGSWVGVYYDNVDTIYA